MTQLFPSVAYPFRAQLRALVYQASTTDGCRPADPSVPRTPAWCPASPARHLRPAPTMDQVGALGHRRGRASPSTAAPATDPAPASGRSAVRQGSRLLRPYNPAHGRAALRTGPSGRRRGHRLHPVQHRRSGDADRGGSRRAAAEGAAAWWRSAATTPSPCPCCGPPWPVTAPWPWSHFDAHLDTWDTYFGQRFTHGTPFRRAWEEGLLLADRSVHVGLRGRSTPRRPGRRRRHGLRADHHRRRGRRERTEVDEQVLDRVGDAPVYVSVDIDVLDPAHAPGTGTPEAGGLTSRELARASSAAWAIRRSWGVPTWWRSPRRTTIGDHSSCGRARAL